MKLFNLLTSILCLAMCSLNGWYVTEFKTAAGEALAISMLRGETTVLKHFQERMPYGLFVPDVDVS
jgi:hypothetical protein